MSYRLVRMADWAKVTSRGEVEDRRGMAPMALGGLSLSGVALLFVVNLLMGGTTGDFLRNLQNVAYQQPATNVNSPTYQGQDSYEVFASEVLGSNNDTWHREFTELNKNYTEPKLVLFRTATNSACGGATSDVGPHYCPLDQTIYLDETFFDELTSRFGAHGGDVAQAYVISHEVGHHVQNELGTMKQEDQEIEANPSEANAISIKLELQADCYAGMWLNSIKDQQILQPGEVSEAMDAAAAVGDDRIQSKVTGQINPETWTHGSSAKRLSWFDKGYNQGTLAACNTFQ